MYVTAVVDEVRVLGNAHILWLWLWLLTVKLLPSDEGK
jgi:hypothetical protein